jgi:hypothetical protein
MCCSAIVLAPISPQRMIPPLGSFPIIYGTFQFAVNRKFCFRVLFRWAQGNLQLSPRRMVSLRPVESALLPAVGPDHAITLAALVSVCGSSSIVQMHRAFTLDQEVSKVSRL